MNSSPASVAPTELVEAIVGSLFLAIALAAVVAGLSARPRRDRTAVWFGVFCVLYGLRLAAKSELIHVVTPWEHETFHYVDAFVTYTILLPAGLFVETLIGRGWHGLVRRAWQATCVYGAGAIVNDLARGEPLATMWLNPPVVLGTVLLQMAHIAARARTARWPAELAAVAAAGTVFGLVAIYETVSDRGLLGANVDAEPFAMLLFTAVLGWFVLTRAREQAYSFVALSRELDLARDIQRSLLPRSMPNVAGLRMQGTYLPMSAVAGDFYDVTQMPDGRLIVIVADVSGHGVPAALVASMVKIAFAAESERFDRPGDILTGINRTLTGKFERAYITACCVIIDPARQAIGYSAAGHPPAILRRTDGRIERLDQGGVVLTLLPAILYPTADVPFFPGDRLLLFTDGLLEATREGSEDEFFGDAELARVVAAAPPLADMSQAILQAYRHWIGPATPLSDDVTLVVVESVELAAASA